MKSTYCYHCLSEVSTKDTTCWQCGEEIDFDEEAEKEEVRHAVGSVILLVGSVIFSAMLIMVIGV